MDIRIDGDPGTGNSFQEIHINNVETYAPNATTVINNHYGDRKAPQAAADPVAGDAGRILRRSEILQYASNLKQYVAPGWKNRYESLWHSILDLPGISAVVYEPGKQKDTTFNRNLVANIVYMMCNTGIITETNATTLTLALEGDKEHSVRAQLRTPPEDAAIRKMVEGLLKGEEFTHP